MALSKPTTTTTEREKHTLHQHTLTSLERMDIESLANELLLDLFEYLSSIDLLQGFYDLNIRFNHLIFLHFQTHALNFQSISKSHFDFICQNSLPSLINRISSLRLSDDDDTPEQIHLFFTYNFSLLQFTYLQTLSIYRIYSFHSLQRLIDELPFLHHLCHLKITRHNIAYNEIYDIGIIDPIGRLEKLISCHLDITNDNDRCFFTPSIISSSLIELSIPHLSCNMNQLINLIQHLSHLQSLHIRIVDHSTNLSNFSREFATIKKLKLLFYGSYQSMHYLLQLMPNLEEFKLNMPSTYIDGYQWETIIQTNLVRLCRFQFKMSTSLSNQKNREEKIDEILDSFRRPFWLDIHQWFVQCHWVLTEMSSVVSVYTLPYAFPNFLYIGNGQLKSTCPNHRHQDWSFDRIHNLYYGYIPSQNFSFSYIRLNNLQYLDLTIPFDDSFWSMVPTLNRLKSLNIVLNSDMDSYEIRTKLQILIDRANHLHSLTFFSWSNQNIFPFQIKTFSIRQLNLQSLNLVYNYEQCIELTQSSIGKQCQVLLINVEQRTHIIYLVNHMPNLRALTVQCSKELQPSKKDDNLLQWLRQHLDATCPNSNLTQINDNIRLWIR